MYKKLFLTSFILFCIFSVNTLFAEDDPCINKPESLCDKCTCKENMCSSDKLEDMVRACNKCGECFEKRGLTAPEIKISCEPPVTKIVNEKIARVNIKKEDPAELLTIAANNLLRSVWAYSFGCYILDSKQTDAAKPLDAFNSIDEKTQILIQQEISNNCVNLGKLLLKAKENPDPNGNKLKIVDTYCTIDTSATPDNLVSMFYTKKRNPNMSEAPYAKPTLDKNTEFSAESAFYAACSLSLNNNDRFGACKEWGETFRIKTEKPYTNDDFQEIKANLFDISLRGYERLCGPPGTGRGQSFCKDNNGKLFTTLSSICKKNTNLGDKACDDKVNGLKLKTGVIAAAPDVQQQAAPVQQQQAQQPSTGFKIQWK